VYHYSKADFSRFFLPIFAMSVEKDKLQFYKLEKLDKVEREIKDLTSSEEYKLLAKKNVAWATQKPTDQEKAEWLLLQQQLADLKQKEKFWQDAILTSNASHARKQDSVGKLRTFPGSGSSGITL
jgi:hypothetical protein